MDEFTVDYSVCRRLRKEAAAQCWAVARKLVWGLSLTIACQCALAQALYRIKPIGYLGSCGNPYTLRAVGLNGSDEVALTACNARGETHAFLWNNDGTAMVDLGPAEVGSASYAAGINASGQIGGSAHDSTGYFAFLASGAKTPMTRIYNTLGGDSVEANALNDHGQLTGEASIPYDFNTGVASVPFIWRNDGSPMLGLSSPNFWPYNAGVAINNSGQLVGFSYDGADSSSVGFVWLNNGTPVLELTPRGGGADLINASGQVSGGAAYFTNNRYKAYLWKNDGTPIKSLGTLGGAESWATAFNNLGQVAGASYTLRFLKPHAFLWLNDGTPMKDLGTFGGTTSQANDMNASGQVTGYAYLAGDSVEHAFLWRNDGTKTQDLNTLIDPTDPLKAYVTLTNGEFINDIGDIVADGTDSRTGVSAPYLLQGTVLTLAPRSLAFGNQPINTKSAAKSVTMTNTSAKVVAITNIALKGSGSTQFTTTNNCGSSLMGHAICTIKVTFKPTTKGAKSATLNVNGGGGGLRVVNLTGTGR